MGVMVIFTTWPLNLGVRIPDTHFVGGMTCPSVRTGNFEEESEDGIPNCLTLSLVAMLTTPFPLSTDIS